MTTSEGKRNQIDSLLRACRLVSRLNKNRPDSSQSEQLYYGMLEKYFGQLPTRTPQARSFRTSAIRLLAPL